MLLQFADDLGEFRFDERQLGMACAVGGDDFGEVTLDSRQRLADVA